MLVMPSLYDTASSVGFHVIGSGSESVESSHLARRFDGVPNGTDWETCLIAS